MKKALVTEHDPQKAVDKGFITGNDYRKWHFVDWLRQMKRTCNRTATSEQLTVKLLCGLDKLGYMGDIVYNIIAIHITDLLT